MSQNTVRAIPVFCDNNTHYFVEQTLLKPKEIELPETGQTIKTSYLKCGVTFTLLGITQSDELFKSNYVSPNDSLSPDISVEKVLLRIGKKCYEIDIEDAKFEITDNDFKHKLHLDYTKTIKMNINSIDIEFTVKLYGYVNIELADICIHSQIVETKNLPNMTYIDGYMLHVLRG